MKVAVVTALHSAKPEWFAQCCASVRAQTHACMHIVVADGIARPPMPGFEGQFIALEKKHADYGDTPRAIGSMSAIAQGFDAIAYLDDDNWFHPQHLESLVVLQQRTGAALCSSARMLHALDGSVLARCPAVDGVHFVDTNCFFISRAAFALCAHWALMPSRFHLVGDRYIWMVAHYLRLSHAHTGLASLHYRSNWAVSYTLAGRTPPAGAKTGDEVLELLGKVQGYFESGDWQAGRP